jgi:glycerol-3-phosphate cytidylyltransferase
LKAGITFGAFDLCHAGHNLMFGECKQNCDYLIVGLQADPSIERQEKNKPVQSMFERYVQLNSCRYIDEIVPYVYESEIEEILRSVKPYVRFIGADYHGRDFTAKQYCLDNNIELYFNNRDHGFSTTELRRRISAHTSNGM